jgi:group I intron endonuclease
MAVSADPSDHPAPSQGGIYAIRCLPTSRFYVGSARSFCTRWQAHRALLRGKRHPNPKLQKAWNRHGEKSFIFEVLEVVEDLARLAERELAWVNRLKPDLNLYLTWYQSRPSSLAGRRVVRPANRIELRKRPGAA